MIKSFKYFFYVLIILQCSSSLALFSENKNLNLSQVQGGFSYLQSTDGSSSGVIFNYTPRYYLNSNLSAGLDLGVQIAKYRQDQTLTAIEYLAAVDYSFNEVWQATLLLGAQAWTNSGAGTYLARGAQLSYQLPEPVFGYNMSIWGRYLLVDYTPAVQFFSSGIALQF